MSQKASFLLAATALLTVAHPADAEFYDLQKEQCYCVAKAGHNDCANSIGSHNCATYSTEDKDCAEWILLPAGTCHRIAGGSLEPKK